MSARRMIPLGAALIALAAPAFAQTPAANDQPTLGLEPGAMQPVMDRGIFAHAILNENEGRWNGSNTQYRWSGEGWLGTDYDKLWIKSEGTRQSDGTLEDGQHQFLYDRAITTYFDVAASDPHWPVTRWVFDTVRIRSIKAHAAGIEAPPGLDDPARLVVGTEHFAAHCAVCHGAPGVPKGDIARGLNPQPPDLKEISSLYTPPELLWILKHGIRMTGMPSWADHSDEELWAAVAFIEKLPGMTPEEYAKLVMASIAHGGHQHRTGGEPSGAAPPGSEQATSPH